MLVPSKVRNHLVTNEIVVFSTYAKFSIPDSSFLGDKTVHITSNGRVIAHDSGGVLGEEKIWRNNGGIEVKYSNNKVLLSNKFSYKLPFTITLNKSEFINIYRQIPSEKFIIDESDLNACYVSEDFTTESSINYEKIYIKENHIELSSNKNLKKFPFNRIKNISYNNNSLKIIGVFNIGYKNINEIEIFILNKEIKNQIEVKLSKYNNVYNFIGETKNIFPISITTIENNPLIFSSIAFLSESIVLMKEDSKIHVPIYINEYKFYYNHQNKKLLLISQEKSKPSYIIQSDNQDFVKYIKNNLLVSGNTFYPRFGNLSGKINGDKYNNTEVTIAISVDEMYLISEGMINKVDFNLGEITLFLEESKMFFLNNEEIALLSSNNLDKIKACNGVNGNVTNTEFKDKIGYTIDNKPFYITQTDKELILKYSSNEYNKFKNETIVDISIEKQPENDVEFTEVWITFIDNKILKLNISQTYVNDLVYRTYYYSKVKRLPKIDSEQLFLSYSRQVNDYVLYHYFGQLIAIYEGLKDILERKENKDIKNRAIITYLYHAIQSQKKHFDTVSIYLPAMLEKTDNKTLKGVNPSTINNPYKNMQRGLMSLTSQISRSLYEIESSISAVSFAVIPQKDYSSLIDKRKKRGYINAGIMGIGGFFVPPMLIGSSFMLINTYLNNKDAKEQEEIRLQNEKNRLDFHVDKIMDSFNHFIEILLPFYISEVNQTVFQTFKQLHIQYQPVLHLEEIRESLFNRIAEFYTFKQLPIDETVNLKKNHLIEVTNFTLELANNHSNAFLQEVEEIVPKSIEIPRLG